MKRIQMFLAGAFIAVGSLYAQSSDAEWQAGVAKLKEIIQTNPAQANEEAEQLIKGKNKKNVELLVAIGEVYLKAGKLPEAQEYAALAKKRMVNRLLLLYWKEISLLNRKMQVWHLRNMKRLFISIRIARKHI